jgi:DNA-binding PadR family transcriptional regulator
MCARHDDWFGDLFRDFDPERWSRHWQRQWRRPRRRAAVFESGEMKYVILRLIREKPRHGYEIIKELEERFGGWYSPSPGAVYPTLQLLEDQGYLRSDEADGRKVYRITPEGEAFLDEHRDTIDDMLDRIRETLRDVSGGAIGELSQAMARLAALSYREAWRRGPDDPATRRIVEVLERAVEEIRQAAGRP